LVPANGANDESSDRDELERFVDDVELRAFGVPPKLLNPLLVTYAKQVDRYAKWQKETFEASEERNLQFAWEASQSRSYALETVAILFAIEDKILAHLKEDWDWAKILLVEPYAEEIGTPMMIAEFAYWLGVFHDPERKDKEKDEALVEAATVIVQEVIGAGAEKLFAKLLKKTSRTEEQLLKKSITVEQVKRIIKKLHLGDDSAKGMAELSKKGNDIIKKLFLPEKSESDADSGRSRLIMQDGSKKSGVGGVRSYYDARVLRRIFTAAGAEKSRRLLSALEKRLTDEKDPARQQQVLQDFISELKTSFKASRGLSEVNHLVLVSVKELVTHAERYAGHWDDLPQDLRTPGRLSRVRGFVMDPGRGDILLLGNREQAAPMLELDDLVVAVREIWQKGGTPMCSLDPDPDEFAAKRVGSLKVRLVDLPRDCGFARALLDADYAMKKVLFGTAPVRAEGFKSLNEILQAAGPAEVESLQSRFWFVPIPPQSGDVQVSRDGRVALFQSKLEVLTERMILNRNGQLAGAGSVDSAAEQAAASLTQHLADIAPEQPHFQKLQLLTDLVLLSGLWREGGVKSPLLDRLARLPSRRVSVPESYPGIRQPIGAEANADRWLFGGVHLKAPVGPASWLVLDDEDIKLVRTKARDVRFDRDLAAALPGVSVRLPAPTGLPSPRRGNPVLALRKLSARDWDGALVEADQAVETNPDDPLPRAVRALAQLAQGNLLSMRADVLEAHQLSLGDTDMDTLLVSVLEYGLAVMRETRNEDGPNTAAVGSAGTKEKALLRGTILLLLGQVSEARQELQKAIDLDPDYASAYARLAFLEAAQGFRIRGKQRAEKAIRLNPNLAEAKAVLAWSELRLSHLAAAEKQAAEVIAQPFAEVQARVMAYKVLVGVAARRGEWQNTELLLEKAQRGLTGFAQVPVWLFAAEEAREGGRDDMSAAWLTHAERLAPRSGAVAAAKRRLASLRPSQPAGDDSSPKSKGAPSAPATDNGNSVPSDAGAGRPTEAQFSSGWALIVLLALTGVAGAVVLLRRHRRAGQLRRGREP
jgi:tetratricopeptide (TPR) repeat protein